MEKKNCPLVMTVHNEQFSYQVPISVLDEAVIEQARQAFENYSQRGIITAKSFDDETWSVSSEVLKRNVHFDLDKCSYEKNFEKILGCSYDFVCQALRAYCVIGIARGVALISNISAVNTIKAYLKIKKLPSDLESYNDLENFLLFLPPEPITKIELIQKLEDQEIVLADKRQGDNKRTMSYYRTYLLFDKLLKDYWQKATEDEKCLFFPVWFWWNISGILPLRPTCVVLTPRNCLREEAGKYYLTVRRTRLKKAVGSRYSIEEDYERCEYRLPADLYSEINHYLELTKDDYESDIDVLFSKAAQFKYLGIVTTNNNHYTYNNLRQCLDAFYRKVIIEKYQYQIVNDVEDLNSCEIERIALGDTRVLSMISLFNTGNSATVCKELARHEGIEMSDHYYSNLNSFLDALSFSLYRSDDIGLYSMRPKVLIKEDTPPH